MSNFTFTSEDFKNVHNALCDLRSVCDSLEGVLNPALFKKLIKARDGLRAGLNNVYEQESKSFSTKSDHYSAVQEQLGLSAIWSIYEVDNLNERHPFEGATKVHYKDHWGKPVTKEINGGTWAALYVAGNAAIRDSGDDHHVFIEQFAPSKTDATVLIMQTGS